MYIAVLVYLSRDVSPSLSAIRLNLLSLVSKCVRKYLAVFVFIAFDLEWYSHVVRRTTNLQVLIGHARHNLSKPLQLL